MQINSDRQHLRRNPLSIDYLTKKAAPLLVELLAIWVELKRLLYMFNLSLTVEETPLRYLFWFGSLGMNLHSSR
jgi:hypothetical protein